MSKYRNKKNASKWYYNDCVEYPNLGLDAYLGRVKSGYDEIITTDFYGKSTSIDKIIQDWSKVLSTIESDYPGLMQFENDLRAKVGPLSVMKPLKDRMDDIKAYYKDVERASQPISPQAIQEVCHEWRNCKTSLRNVDNTIRNMKLSTNSGVPFFTKRRNPENLFLARNVDFANMAGDECYVYFTKKFEFGDKFGLSRMRDKISSAAVLGWRGQEGGPSEDDVKQRVVWMFPFPINVLELRAYQPLIELAQKNSIVPAWISLDDVFYRMTELFDTKDPDDYIICTDFSRFDQHFNADMQTAANTVLDFLLDESKDKWWIENIFPIKYRIPLIIGKEYVMFGRHGMASGSGGTNFDETLTHRSLQYECAMAHGAKLNPNSMCLGDDGVLSYPGITVDDVIDTYSSHGQDMNPDKQHVSKDDAIYLRRYYHKDYRENGKCVGVYSTYRALNRLKMRERRTKIWTPEVEVLRELSIIENCKYHPLRDEFISFCYKGSAHGLGMFIPGFLENAQLAYDKAIASNSLDLSYTTTIMEDKGINEWWSFQWVCKKSGLK
nr:MAG: putative RNA-dependent RNA polymerase [Picobirnavirus sp.]